MGNKETSSTENAPDKSRAALLLIDIISDFEFEDGEKLFEQTLLITQNIANLKKQAKAANIPVIYINDHFGKWREDFQTTVKNCLRDDARGCQIVRLLKPEADDYFVLKPKHSAFYSTTLDLLLKELGTEIIIFAGISADICVLFSANDAYMRGFQIYVPQDCVASVEEKENTRALKYIERVLKAEIKSSGEVNFSELAKDQNTESQN